jgi:uncharacterized protein (TIGR02271 family)
MAMNQDAAVVGVFEDRTRATQAVEQLKQAGFTDNQIGIAYRDPQAATAADGGTTTTETAPSGGGAAAGAVGGGILGGIIGAAAALLIPGIGPVVAGGILAAALGGAAIGAAAGGIIGALTGMGVPEEEARYYDTEFQRGRTIVTVQPDGRRQEAIDILRRNGAYDATNRAAMVSTTGGSGMRPYGAEESTTQNVRDQGPQKVQLREEQLTATKQPVQTGEVNLHKTVHEEEHEVPVNLKHEEVVVNRQAVDRPAEPGQIGDMQDEVIRVPVYEEQAQLQKQARVREEVEVEKRAVNEQQTMTGTTRREDLQVERSGDVNVHGNVDTTGAQDQDLSQAD